MQYNELPKLIDASTGYYLSSTLRQCHDNRVVMYSQFLNVIVVVGFLCLGAFVLYLCFRRKLTPDEEKEKLQREQEMILEKIRALQEQKQHYYDEATFTQLPTTNTSYV